MEKMDYAVPLEFMLYKYHSNPETLAAAKAVLDIHPDFVTFFSDKIPMERSDLIRRKPLFMQDPSDAMWYSIQTKDTGEDMQRVIVKNPYLAVSYAIKLGKRLPVLEAELLPEGEEFNHVPDIILKYLKQVVKRRWPELEDKILMAAKNTAQRRDQTRTHNILVEYAAYLFEMNTEIPNKLMDLIQRDGDLIIDFTIETGVRWPKLESVIKADIYYWSEYFYRALKSTDMPDREVDQLKKQWVADRLRDLNAERESLRDLNAKKGK